MSILITGGCGYVGSVLVNKLISQKQKVKVIDNQLFGNFLKINPYLKYMREGFFWGFVAICLRKKIKIHQININHRLRLSGKTNVFHLNKIPSIALRNILGLIKLKIIKINY